MTEHLPECPKSGCPACYEQGQRDAIAAAVQRVEALREPWPDVWPGLILRAETIAAIKGDKP
jgi:hypothetical protein